MFEISRLDETVIRALLTGSLRVYYCMCYEYSWFWPNLSILAIGIAVGLNIPLIHDVLLVIIPPTMTDVEDIFTSDAADFLFVWNILDYYLLRVWLHMHGHLYFFIRPL